MILVDTSAWIEQLRAGGRAEVRQRVEAILASGEAVWCPIIRLELWNGARGQQEAKALRLMEEVLRELEITSDVWKAANDLARKSRIKGMTFPPQDIIVAACAQYYAVPLEHADSHFELLMKI
jgi:predicted nucleic acid-binding protein